MSFPADGMVGGDSGMAGANDSMGELREAVRVTFDSKADAAYITLAKFGPGEAVTQVIVEGVPSPADIVLDFDARGQLLGVEVIGARAVLSPRLLAAAEAPPPHKS